MLSNLRLLLLFRGLFVPGLTGARAQTPAPARPNFLFVYLDDQRWDAMSFYQRQLGNKARFPWLKTPNLDRLAAEGVWFRNAFATDSLCSPSRASFLTGQYPHTHGVVNNHMDLPAGDVTYGTLLHGAGYFTGFVGKWHMGSQRDRPGFDYSASFIGQGLYFNCPFIIDEKETVISHKWTDETSVDYALGFLKQHLNQPFCLAVGLKSVHDPRDPNPQDRDLYTGDEARPVPNMNVRAVFEAPFPKKPLSQRQVSGEDFIDYFRCLTSADRAVGRLMDGLDQLGLSQNTMVIYSSDNGYDLGEHELGDKRAAYEEAMRIPFLVRAPFIAGTKGKAVDQMVLNVDVAPTLLDFAGVTIPKTMQGRSLRPLLEEKNVSDWSRSFLYEYFFEKTFRWPTMVAVRTDNSKLVTYPNHPEWTEVYDLDRDPYEIHNQAGKPEAKALQDSLQAELDRLKGNLSYYVPGDSDKDTYVEDVEKNNRDSEDHPPKHEVESMPAPPPPSPEPQVPNPPSQDFHYPVPKL